VARREREVFERLLGDIIRMHHHSMTSVGRHCVGQRTLIAILMTVPLFATALPAHAEPTVTANDENDVADELDIRSATLSPESGDRSRITLRFWNDVPPELLEGRAIRMELSYSEDGPSPGQYVVGFFRNSDGFGRMVWGEGGSNCCFVVAGGHPNDFTYTGVLPFSFYGAQPPPIWLRGESTKQLDCRAGQRRACTLFTGRAADRTPWVEF
jgi:hypothetical protein